MTRFFSSRTIAIAVLVCAAAGAQQVNRESGGTRAASRVSLGENCALEYVGAFLADGSFKGRSRLRLGELVNKVAGEPEETSNTPAAEASEDAAPARQRVVEDYAPGAHPVETVKGRPVLADVVDAITNFAAEHEAVMESPRSLSTDARGRVIVTDPSAHAVHVLDFRGKTSFRIQGGKDRRLQMPVGTATDSQDNIYVSDADRGMVLVYDPLGRFRHYIGKIKGEAFFEQPAGIAIDRRMGRVYVADSPRNAVVVLDLHGAVLGSWGGKTSSGMHPEFSKPTSIVLRGEELFVLDNSGERVQVVDLQGNLRREISLSRDNASATDRADLAIDGKGNIYVSDEQRGMVRVYNRDGRLLSLVGRAGSKIGEFKRPRGLWRDGQDRIYVADSDNHRIQVFQFRGTKQQACQ